MTVDNFPASQIFSHLGYNSPLQLIWFQCLCLHDNWHWGCIFAQNCSFYISLVPDWKSYPLPDPQVQLPQILGLSTPFPINTVPSTILSVPILHKPQPSKFNLIHIVNMGEQGPIHITSQEVMAAKGSWWASGSPFSSLDQQDPKILRKSKKKTVEMVVTLSSAQPLACPLEYCLPSSQTSFLDSMLL